MSGYQSYARAYFEHGWAPLPVPHGRKKPPPDAWTGLKAPYPGGADVEAWIEVSGQANIALRLPFTVIGLDVDCYDGKPGAANFAAMIEEMGPLPPTVRSTSRDDGLSGIRFYRVPEDWRPGRKMPRSVDLIWAGYRYAMVWPSVHPNGNEYGWIGLPASAEIPDPKALPDLPKPWLDGLATREQEWTAHESRQDERFQQEVGPGERQSTCIALAGSLRNRGLPLWQAEAVVENWYRRYVIERKTFTLDDAMFHLADIYQRYPAGRIFADGEEAERTHWEAPELMTATFAPLRFLLEGILPVGLSMIAAAPKTGKTRFTMQLGISVALGVEAIGRPTGKAPVLYYALEDSARRVRSYLLQHPEHKRLLDSGDALVIRTAARQLGGEVEADISGWLSQNPGGLVIVDILQRIRQERKSGANTYHADYSELSSLQSLARYHDASVLLVHHTNQLRDAPDPFERINGTSGINGVVDTLLLLDRPRHDRYGKLTVAGRDVIEQEMALDFAGGWWSPTDMPTELLALAPRVRDLWLWLREHEGAGLVALAKQYGVSEDGTRKILRKLEEDGLIDRVGGTGQGTLARYVVIPVPTHS